MARVRAPNVHHTYSLEIHPLVFLSLRAQHPIMMLYADFVPLFEYSTVAGPEKPADTSSCDQNPALLEFATDSRVLRKLQMIDWVDMY